MNCKPGEIAFIKNSHPHQHLHGVLVNCVGFLGDCYGEIDVWEVDFCGAMHADDDGNMGHGGLIQDRYLRPIRGGESPEQSLEAMRDLMQTKKEKATT